MTKERTASLAVWDVPSPVTASETFKIKVGAKAADGRNLAGAHVEVSDGRGAVSQGTLGAAPLADTEALYWLETQVPAPAAAEMADYTVRLVANGIEAITTRFTVAVTEKPTHRLTLSITEGNSAQALDGVEVRFGPFHARTDGQGRAELLLCTGDYRVQLWRAAHIAQPQAISIDGDADLKLTMTFVPEDHPDARWVR